MVWPSPEPVTLQIDTKHSSLQLPVLTAHRDQTRVRFGRAEEVAALKTTVLREGQDRRELHRDIENSTTTFSTFRDDGSYVIDDIGTEINYRKDKRVTIADGKPETAEATVSCVMHYRRADWDARVETDTRMSCDRKYFYLDGSVRTFDKGKPFMERRFREKIKRDNL